MLNRKDAKATILAFVRLSAILLIIVLGVDMCISARYLAQQSSVTTVRHDDFELADDLDQGLSEVLESVFEDRWDVCGMNWSFLAEPTQKSPLSSDGAVSGINGVHELISTMRGRAPKLERALSGRTYDQEIYESIQRDLQNIEPVRLSTEGSSFAYLVDLPLSSKSAMTQLDSNGALLTLLATGLHQNQGTISFWRSSGYVTTSLKGVSRLIPDDTFLLDRQGEYFLAWLPSENNPQGIGLIRRISAELGIKISNAKTSMPKMPD